MTIKENIQSTLIKAAITYLDNNPEKNIPKLISAVEKMDTNHNLSKQIKVFRNSFEDKSGNWYKLAESLYSDIDNSLRKRIFENIVINATVIGMERQKSIKKEYNCNAPWAILLDPTTSCNLKCKGCWAADYEKNIELPINQWDSIIWQGKALGTFTYLYSGGEPLVRNSKY